MAQTVAAQKQMENIEGISRRLCEAVEHWTYDDIPADVVQTLRLLVIDTLGVIGGAARAPGIAEINGRLAKWENGGSATALIGKHRFSPPNAAMSNGAAAHALDFDDMHDPARIHAFCVLLPIMIAVAEDIGNVDGKRFLLALAVAAEVHARLGFTCYNSLGKGWHPTTTLGSMAGAIGAGRMLGLTGDKLVNALGIAFHQAQGTAQSMHDGVLTKRLGPGFAARNAVTAAFFAQDGITGPFRSLEGAAGLFRLFERDEVKPEVLLEDIGKEWRTRGFSFKPYPCCRCNHTTIDLAFDLRKRGIGADDIKSVEVRLPQVNFQTVGQPYDVTRDSVVHAQFNIGYTFARALIDGKVTLPTYTKPNIADPKVVALASRVKAMPDPTESPTAMEPSKVRVELNDNTTVLLEGRKTKGAPDAPMSVDELLGKFADCLDFGMSVPRASAQQYAERVLKLEQMSNVSDLIRDFPSKAG
ncbi:MAG: MmgE/PrpD family protein [Pseudolabrys sp.]